MSANVLEAEKASLTGPGTRRSRPAPLVSKTSRLLLLALWLAVFAAMPVWIHFDPPGWDVDVYRSAIQSVRAGGDPYADAAAVQDRVHTTGRIVPQADPPYSYVYSPMTLPLVGLIGTLPLALSGSLYWLSYLAGALAEIWVAMQMVESTERRVFLFLAPISAFFPGLLANGIILSGNVAYLLYGLAMLAAVLGWRRGRWLPFYLVVIAASCVKAPLLTLLALPVLSARRQWAPALASATAGLALFAIQPRIWPSLFQHYLRSVDLQFAYNRDFGASPAGLFSGWLFDHGHPYTPAAPIFYLAYALPLFGLLVHLSRLYLAGRIALSHWLPVLLTGVILLNPRLIEYDVAPLALPLALIAWRVLPAHTNPRLATLLLTLAFLLLNAFALSSWTLRKLIDGPLLVCLLLAGAFTLLREAARKRLWETAPTDA